MFICVIFVSYFFNKDIYMFCFEKLSVFECNKCDPMPIVFQILRRKSGDPQRGLKYVRSFQHVTVIPYAR